MPQQTADIVSTPNLDVSYYFHQIALFFTGHYPEAFNGLKYLFGYFVGLCIILSILFFIGIIYCVEGLKRARNKEEEMMSENVEMGYEADSGGDVEMTKRWNRILVQIDSKNESDWRQAIIEADIMLEDLLVKLGYQGATIGDRLKRVAKGDFKTLQSAWDAHLVRNNIAHEGSNYPLSQLEAINTINLYKQVFEEFYHI